MGVPPTLLIVYGKFPEFSLLSPTDLFLKSVGNRELTPFLLLLVFQHIKQLVPVWNIVKPCHEKIYLWWFATRKDINQPVQLQKLASLGISARANIGIIDILSRQRTTKAPIRLPWCTGWSASLLIALYGIRQVFSWLNKNLKIWTPKKKL